MAAMTLYLMIMVFQKDTTFPLWSIVDRHENMILFSWCCVYKHDLIETLTQCAAWSQFAFCYLFGNLIQGHEVTAL